MATHSVSSISTLSGWEAATQDSPFKGGRKRAPKTPSVYTQGPTHNCAVHNPETTEMKVCNRFFHSLDRFGFADVWGCSTLRGRTHYNGASSHCGGCEAAHAALSPTLYDNILQIVKERIVQTGYQNIEEQQKAYLRKRLAFTAEDERILSSESEETRLLHLERKTEELLTPQQLMGSWVHTDAEFGRNATFENPKGANRIDSYLEGHLRPLEDLLANSCSNHQKTAKEALQILHARYQELLRELEPRLLADQQKLFVLHDAWKECSKSRAEMAQRPQEETDWEPYLQSAKSYRAAFSSRFQTSSIGKGVPICTSLRKALTVSLSLENLRDPSKPQSPLWSCSDIDRLFAMAHGDVEERLEEIKAQQAFTEKPFEEIHACMKVCFGDKDSRTSAFRTPTKEYLYQQHLTRFSAPTQARKKLHLDQENQPLNI